MLNDQRGENLVELVVVLAVAILVIGALVFSVISSLRNADFSKNQLQATKYTQEGIEAIRSMRDRGGNINNFPPTGAQAGTISSWLDNDLWTNRITVAGVCDPCYFLISDDQQSIRWSANDDGEVVDEDGEFSRYLVLDDEVANYQQEKKVTVVVRWQDVSGPHESRVTTILRKL